MAKDNSTAWLTKAELVRHAIWAVMLIGAIYGNYRANAATATAVTEATVSDLRDGELDRAALRARITIISDDQKDFQETTLIRREAFQAEIRERLNSIEVSIAKSQATLEQIEKRIP